MEITTKKSTLAGRVRIPGSKSHTIRAVAIAALAEGTSTIREPLISQDALSARSAYTALGAKITGNDDAWLVEGINGKLQIPTDVIDVGNSGTSLRMLLGSCALIPEGEIKLTGDYQIQRRPSQPLITALNNLGANIISEKNNGCAPITVKGTLAGGETDVDCLSSQYVSAILLNAPLAKHDTVINVVNPNELPYIDMTLWWLDKQGIDYSRKAFEQFTVKGNQQYKAFDLAIPSDFSSATFFLCAGAICEGSILIEGLDLDDPQGDKMVIDYLKNMGAKIDISDDGIRVSHSQLHGTKIDMNATPDALPAMAVVACFANSPTHLHNVAQARIKETDRIKVMTDNLRALGATIEELPDGMIIHPSTLSPGKSEGHDDHRIVMAMAIAGLASGEISVDTAEAAAITFPQFSDLGHSIGGVISQAD